MFVNARPGRHADDAALMDFAQEQSVETIACWLHRTARAVTAEILANFVKAPGSRITIPKWNWPGICG